MRLTKRIEQLESSLRIGNIHYIIKTSDETFENAFERHVAHVTACKLNKGIDWLGLKSDYLRDQQSKHIRLIEIHNPYLEN